MTGASRSLCREAHSGREYGRQRRANLAQSWPKRPWLKRVRTSRDALAGAVEQPPIVPLDHLDQCAHDPRELEHRHAGREPICLLLLDQEPDRYERAAVRWLGRLLREPRRGP